MASPPPPEDMAETITEQEVILEGDGRAISILVAREDVTVTEGRCPARATIAGPHIHQRHTDAFYVIGGELTFEVGRESEVITISPGGLVAVPPGVAHSFRNDGGRPAHWLTIHAPDGGFAALHARRPRRSRGRLGHRRRTRRRGRAGAGRDRQPTA